MTIKTLTLALTATLTLGTDAFADINGTPDEARAMLERVVVAMEADKNKALAAFNAGEPEFKDGDLYAFCTDADPDGLVIAHGGAPDKVVGVPTSAIKDANGMQLGDHMTGTAAEGEITLTDVYWWPIPDPENPIEKRAFITLVSDAMCGVSYFN